MTIGQKIKKLKLEYQNFYLDIIGGKGKDEARAMATHDLRVKKYIYEKALEELEDWISEKERG